MSTEHWEHYFSRVNGSLASILVDVGLVGTAPDASRPRLLWVWLDLRSPREDGLSDDREAPALREIEDAIAGAAGAACGARLAGRITTSGRREMYFYGPGDEGFAAAVKDALARFPGYTLWADSQDDAPWRQYLEVLYPNPRDRERIRNRRVIEALEERGDALKAPRPVRHWIVFERALDRDRFAARAAPLGFTISTPAPADPDGRSHRLMLERIDRVDWESINDVTLELLDLAVDSRGVYDGWETEVRTDPS